MLTINKLSSILGGKKVLNEISFNVKRGEVAVMLGASGVGKTTLLRVLNNLEKFDEGTIQLDEKPLDVKNVNQSNTVGMVFQQFNLFDHLTVLENITIALEKLHKKNSPEATKIAMELLSHYKLDELIDSYPVQLSGGQKQRLAIARAVALKPMVICFDEPTSALDPMLTTFVATNIQDLANQGYIILIATHDTMLLEKLNCTIYLMQKGSIIQSAQSTEFWTNREMFPLINSFISGT